MLFEFIIRSHTLSTVVEDFVKPVQFTNPNWFQLISQF